MTLLSCLQAMCVFSTFWQVIADAAKSSSEAIEDVHYRLAAAKELGQKPKRGQLCKMVRRLSLVPTFDSVFLLFVCSSTRTTVIDVDDFLLCVICLRV